MAQPRLRKISDSTLDLTLEVLEEFARELQSNHESPSIPYELEASTRGYSMRLATIVDKLIPLDRSECLIVCSRLARILSVLHAYVASWEVKLQDTDRLLADYEFMPGDHNAVDSVRLIAERVNLALHDVFSVLFPIRKPWWKLW